MSRELLSNIEIGKRIKAIRRSAHLTQAQLAEKVHVDPTLISKVETGSKSNLDIGLMNNIAKALDKTLNDLCYDNGEKAIELPDAVSTINSIILKMPPERLLITEKVVEALYP